MTSSESLHGAVISDDGDYRYRLWRTLVHPDQATLEGDSAADGETVAFVLLNPSTADSETDDNTLRRCIDFAKRWGYDRLEVGNLFSYRATDPDELYEADAPIGPENDDHLGAIGDGADQIVVGWGHYGGGFPDRVEEVVELLDAELLALDTTQYGQPRHPLFVLGDVEPEPWEVPDS